MQTFHVWDSSAESGIFHGFRAQSGQDDSTQQKHAGSETNTPSFAVKTCAGHKLRIQHCLLRQAKEFLSWVLVFFVAATGTARPAVWPVCPGTPFVQENI